MYPLTALFIHYYAPLIFVFLFCLKLYRISSDVYGVSGFSNTFNHARDCKSICSRQYTIRCSIIHEFAVHAKNVVISPIPLDNHTMLLYNRV